MSARCVHPDRSGGSHDGGGLPWLLRGHEGVAMHAGTGEWHECTVRVCEPKYCSVFCSLTSLFVPFSSSSSCSSSLRRKWPLGSGGSPIRTRYTTRAHTHTHSLLLLCFINEQLIMLRCVCRWWRTSPSSTSRPTTTIKPPSRKR